MTMKELKDLKAGDDVLVTGMSCRRITKIDKVTKTQIVVNNARFRRDSGDYAKIGSSGDYAKIDSTGEDSVIMCAGNSSRAKAKVGSWITLAEWEWSDEKKRNVPVYVKTEYVDGEKIKADTWYQLRNGKFVEVNK